jgi:hemerythrin
MAGWNPSLATGVAKVDAQHKELFRQVGLLGEAMLRGQGRQEIGKILDFLGKYVVEHFAEEERCMEEYCCPAAAANKQAHAQLLATFGTLKAQFDREGATPTLVLDIQRKLNDWLVQHIERIDKQLAGCAARGKALVGQGA